MPHDRRGTELAVGDVVMVPCRVKAIHLTEDYCNVDLETKLTMPPLNVTTVLTLNSRQTDKPTASHRYREFGDEPAEAPAVSGWQPINRAPADTHTVRVEITEPGTYDIIATLNHITISQVK